MNVLVFNIETIPDIDGGQRINNLQGLDDKSTAKALFHLRKQQSGSDDLPLYLQRIASISLVYRGMGDDMNAAVSVRSLGAESSSEAELLALFFDEIEQRTPTLVSWNGSSFDLAVIHYRSLKNKVSAPSYWEEHNNDDQHSDSSRHIDLMDLLSSYNKSASAPINDIALMLGFPGKEEMDTAQIWEEYLQENTKTIRDYGEVGVLNNYLVYLRFLLIRGDINEEELTREFALLRQTLDESKQAHLQAFSSAWKQ